MEASTKAVIIAAGLGVTAYVFYRSVPQVGKAAAAAGNAVNPLNPDNVFASGVNKVGAAVSGNSSFSLGSWIYDMVHPNDGATSSTPSSSSSIDWGTGTGWDVTNMPTVPMGQVTM